MRTLSELVSFVFLMVVTVVFALVAFAIEIAIPVAILYLLAKLVGIV